MGRALTRDEPGGPFLAGASSIETHTWSGFGPYAIPHPGDSYGLPHPLARKRARWRLETSVP
jgi:hypothetical protein